MAFTLKQGTKCYLVDETMDTEYELLVVESSASQTIQEASHSVKTIHNRNVVDRTFANSKSPVSFNFTFYAEQGFEEVGEAVLKWFGLSSNGLQLEIPLTAQALSRTFYIQANGTVYKISNCFAENLTVTFGPKSIMTFEVTAKGSDLEAVSSKPSISTTYLQDSGNFFISTLNSITANGVSLNNIVSSTFQITRNLNWISDKTIHDVVSGNLYVPQNIVNSGMSITGTITQNKTNNTIDPVYYGALNINAADCILNLGSVKFSQRWNLDSDIHQLVTDYKLLPSSASNYIQI